VDRVRAELLEGGEKLTDIFGFLPTFHDAVVETVTIDREGPTVTIRFKLNELVINEKREKSDIRARALIRWHDVTDLSLSGADPEENNWIDGLIVSPKGEAILTELLRMDGIHGTILASRVEVVEATPGV